MKITETFYAIEIADNVAPKRRLRRHLVRNDLLSARTAGPALHYFHRDAVASKRRFPTSRVVKVRVTYRW
jgi:hypothetical protein